MLRRAGFSCNTNILRGCSCARACVLATMLSCSFSLLRAPLYIALCVTAADEPTARAYIRRFMPEHYGPDPQQQQPEEEEMEIKIEQEWTGIIGWSCDDRPWVGPLPFPVTSSSNGAGTTNPEVSEDEEDDEEDMESGAYVSAGFCGSGEYSDHHTSILVHAIYIAYPWEPLPATATSACNTRVTRISSVPFDLDCCVMYVIHWVCDGNAHSLSNTSYTQY